MPERHLEADGWMEHLNDEAAAAAEPDEFGRFPCVYCGGRQYPDQPYCLSCGRDDYERGGGKGAPPQEEEGKDA